MPENMIGKENSGSEASHKTCRSCMNRGGEEVEMRNLFNSLPEGPVLVLADMMMACTSLKVSPYP